MAVLADFLASLAIGVLRWLAERQDIKDSARAALYLAAAENAKAGLTYKAEHPVIPVSVADLPAAFRVRVDPTVRFTVPGAGAGPAGPPGPPASP